MRITRIILDHFRNYKHEEVEWAPHINVITGPNGAGKTNMIDAIHFLCMSRSFVSTSDLYMIEKGESDFAIRGDFEGRIRSQFSVMCTYARGEGKKINVNDSPLERLSDLIGMVPVVVVSPDDRKLTNEGPAERRSFMDALISQLSRSYLQDLIDYRRIVRQRNRLLTDYRDMLNDRVAEMIEPWNEQLIETGARIIEKRWELLEEFRLYLGRAYELISSIPHKPGFEYKTICGTGYKGEDIRPVFRELLTGAFNKERELEYTTVGPHRDDLLFYLDDFELRKYGSQGQHRLFAISIKLAQLHLFSDRLEDLPILLLDDVFGDLDPHKTEVLLDMLSDHEGQTFITSANRLPFDEHIDFSVSSNRTVRMEELMPLNDFKEHGHTDFK